MSRREEVTLMTNQKKSPSRCRRLRTREVADLTGVPAATLRKWRHEDRGPQSYQRENAVVYDEADVEAWIATRKAATSRGGVR
jgi:predicted DNA-binding transcriptional regulator AlpA